MADILASIGVFVIATLVLRLLRVRTEELAARVNLHLALGGSFEAPDSCP